MGLSLSRGSVRAGHLLSFVSFFVRSESPFLRPDPQYCKAGARRSCQGWPSINLSAYSTLARPYLDSFEHAGTLGAVGMTIRGELAFERESIAPQPCIRWAPRTRTMMQSCASAAKLRGGGPILCYGVIGHGVHRVTATSNRHRRPVTSGRAGPKLLGAFCVLRSLYGTQNDAVRHHALPYEPPQGDQKLARQGHDHGLASAAGVLGTGSEPLRQGAVLLEQEESPRQLDHAPPNPRIPGSRQPFLAALLPALVGRASEARITRYGASIAQVSRQHLLHQHLGRLDANAHHTRQKAHHGMRSLTGCMLEAIQACVLDLLDLIAHEPSALHVAI